MEKNIFDSISDAFITCILTFVALICGIVQGMGWTILFPSKWMDGSYAYPWDLNKYTSYLYSWGVIIIMVSFGIGTLCCIKIYKISKSY